MTLKDKKTERLYIRVTPQFKMEMSQLAWKLHGGNLTDLMQKALTEYMREHGDDK